VSSGVLLGDHEPADMVDSDAIETVVADRMIAPVAVIAADSTLLYINPAGAFALGQDRRWLFGRRMLELVHPEDQPRIAEELRQVAQGTPSAGSTRYRLRADPARGWRTFESTVDNLLDDERVAGLLVSSRDITEDVGRAHALREAAFTDPLTALPNRAAIDEHVASLVAAGGEVALAFVALDRAELLRNSLGHAVADTVTQVVATRTRASVPASMMVGQFRNDVVAVVLTGDAVGEAESLLWRILERLGEPVFVGGHDLRLSASAGLVSRGEISTPDSLLHDAALALHRASSRGGGRIEVFDPSLRQAAAARLGLEANLRRALVNNEFRIELQPIVSLLDGRPVRSEALLRWHHAKVVIPPNAFVGVAEETGLIVPIGDRVLELAASAAPVAPGGAVLVNLSPRQLVSPRLADRIARILDINHLPSDALGFEVTETLLIEHFDYATEAMRRIRQLGCRVGLDDFGTGYSSLGYLRRLPLDFIKIDGTLTSDIDGDQEGRAIVKAIITMADALALDVIAEGIETDAQARTLADLGCSYAQGFHFGRPVPAA